MIHPHGLSKRELSITIVASALLLMLVAFGYVKAKEQSTYSSVLMAQNKEQTNKIQFYHAHEERYKQMKVASDATDAHQQETINEYSTCIEKMHDVLDLNEFWTVNKECSGYSFFPVKEVSKVVKKK